MPTGTVFCILPFTNAFALTLYNTLPQILLGNCVLAKNTATTPGISKLIEKLMINSGLESGEYQNCFVNRDQSA
jgi:acyl-CoA reductase-like NAD-dependent aldehyde dehydrogenase